MKVYIDDTKENELSKWLNENDIKFDLKNGKIGIETRVANDLFALGVKYGKYRQKIRNERKENNYVPTT